MYSFKDFLTQTGKMLITAIFVVEDSVIGTGLGYNQVNAYQGKSSLCVIAGNPIELVTRTTCC